jgi:hypothetical protein
MKRVMRCHDFGSGREARRSQYREYWQGERQSHGPKFVPARRVAATIGGAPKRGAGIGATWSRDPFTGCDRGTDHRRVAPMPILCASPGSDPKGPLFRPATRPLAGMRPRRRARVPRMMARYRPAAGSHPTVKPLEPAPPYAGHFVGRLVHIRDMNCATLRVIPDSGSQRTRASLCYGLLAPWNSIRAADVHPVTAALRCPDRRGHRFDR